MLTINWKQIYEIDNKWILILYDISKNHYVGLPVYNEEQENSLFIKSINKYVVLDEITDYNRTNIKRCIYIKGKPLKINNNEFNDILFKSKDFFLNYVKNNTDNTADGISYNKWCKDKLELIEYMLPKCEHLLLAGGLANSFLKALNFNVGASLSTKNKVTLEKLRNLLLTYREKISLPLDAVVGSSYDESYTRYKKIYTSK